MKERMHLRRKTGLCFLRGLQLALLCLFLAGMLASCKGGNVADPDQQDGFQIYYVNHDETGLVSEPYTPKSNQDKVNEMLQEMLAKLEIHPERLAYEAPISGAVVLRHYFYENGLVTLNFDASYASLDRITEILDRAAIVRTLMQIPGVDAVSFLVDGKPLKDAAGAVVGNMNADTFIYNAGKEINNYDKGRILLYFTSQEGNKLVPIYRTVIYSSNVSMEQVIAEELVKGPASDISRPTINPDTKVLNVTLQDGICYVDFNEKFLSEPYQVKPDIVIYSIVNSLAELTEVNKVQISVNGSTADKFMDSIPLSTLFERKLDME